jgi:hypothetical protein
MASVDLAAVQTRLIGAPGDDRFPVLEVQLAEAQLRQTAFEVTRRLKTGSPAVYVNESRLHEGVLSVLAHGLDEGSAAARLERLRAVLTS